MMDKNILVVEDEFGSAEILQLILEVEGYRVVLAPNGRDALHRTADRVFDLVLTDFMMPLMNGAQLGHALRNNPATANVPIVMMSAADEAEVRRQFSGYDAFLHKPYRIDELLPLLARVVGRAGAAAPPDGTNFSVLHAVRDWLTLPTAPRQTAH